MYGVELWMPVKGYEGIYAVSDAGRIVSLDRQYTNSLGRKRTHTGRELRTTMATSGYSQVTLALNGEKSQESVHDIVASAFCYKDVQSTCVNHINECKTDNRACNLEWCTYAVNKQHSSKLDWDDVRSIRARASEGERQHVIAAEYGISRTYVSAIVCERTWKEMPDGRTCTGPYPAE